MIHVEQYDIGGKEKFELKVNLLSRNDLEGLRSLLKRMHKVEQINFIYNEKQLN
jgi:hypothetical protein